MAQSGKEVITISINSRMVPILDLLAKKHESSRSAFIEFVLREYVLQKNESLVWDTILIKENESV